MDCHELCMICHRYNPLFYNHDLKTSCAVALEIFSPLTSSVLKFLHDFSKIRVFDVKKLIQKLEYLEVPACWQE